MFCLRHSVVMHAEMKAAKLEHSIHGAEASWKLKARPTAHAMSHLTRVAWENVMTNITCCGRAYSTGLGHPHCTLCVGS